MSDPVIYRDIWDSLTPTGRAVLFVPMVLLVYTALILVFLAIPLFVVVTGCDRLLTPPFKKLRATMFRSAP